jgi:ATP-binding protein involved in chromosome partitioning
MSSFTCEHGESYALFGTGGGRTLANDVGAELLGQVPIEPGVAAGGDSGEPVALAGTGAAAVAFRDIATKIAAQTISFDAMSGCAARDTDTGVAVSVRRRDDQSSAS